MKIASLSYGKDSLKMIDVIYEKGYELDRVIHAEIWATKTIPADLPPMVEFKAKADEILLNRYGIVVEHFKAKRTFEDVFYTKIGDKAKIENRGKIKGFPRVLGSWCVSSLKTPALKQGQKGVTVDYVGYAVDEKNPKRKEKVEDYLENGHPNKVFPLVDHNISEQDCYDWCKDNDLLSPIYENATRGGCWFCPKQRLDQLRHLRKEYPDYWAMLLMWDRDNPWGDFNIRYTVHELEERFWQEESQISLFDLENEKES